MEQNRPQKILIASPLEPEQAERIAAAAPGRIEVIFAPDLLPVPRYVADHDGRPRALSAAQRAQWLAHLREADILFDFDWLAPERLLEHAPRLRWVQGTSAGIGERLRRTGLIDSDLLFTTAAGVHGAPLAEFVLLGLLYFYRDVPRLQRMQRAHRWQRYTNRELAGRRALVVGLGAAGRAIAERLAAQGLEVWGARRRPDAPPPDGVRRVLPMTGLAAALGEIDALVLACPLTPETEGLIGARRARGHAGGRAAGQRRARLGGRRAGAGPGACAMAASAAPRSMSPRSSRCPGTALCGTCRTC